MGGGGGDGGGEGLLWKLGNRDGKSVCVCMRGEGVAG